MATERYPTFAAGQRMTAALLTSSQPLVVRKLADTTRAAVTTPAADPELTFSVEASAVYVMDGFIKYAATAAADMLADFSAPSGASGEWVGGGIGLGTSATTTNGYLLRMETRDLTASLTWAGLGSSDAIGVALSGMLRTDTTAGTYSFDWSQAVSDAVAATVYADSWIRLQRIA